MSPDAKILNLAPWSIQISNCLPPRCFSSALSRSCMGTLVLLTPFLFRLRHELRPNVALRMPHFEFPILHLRAFHSSITLCALFSAFWLNIPQSTIPNPWPRPALWRLSILAPTPFSFLSVLINWSRRARAGQNQKIPPSAFPIPHSFPPSFFSPFWRFFPLPREYMVNPFCINTVQRIFH